MKKVYIASPYTNGDVAKNVNKVIQTANLLLDKGYIPYVPHLTHLWHLITPRPKNDWYKIDNEFLKCCDLVIRLPGKSAGADKEIKLADKLKIPVITLKQFKKNYETYLGSKI